MLLGHLLRDFSACVCLFESCPIQFRSVNSIPQLARTTLRPNAKRLKKLAVSFFVITLILFEFFAYEPTTQTHHATSHNGNLKKMFGPMIRREPRQHSFKHPDPPKVPIVQCAVIGTIS